VFPSPLPSRAPPPRSSLLHNARALCTNKVGGGGNVHSWGRRYVDACWLGLVCAGCHPTPLSLPRHAVHTFTLPAPPPPSPVAALLARGPQIAYRKLSGVKTAANVASADEMAAALVAEEDEAKKREAEQKQVGCGTLWCSPHACPCPCPCPCPALPLTIRRVWGRPGRARLPSGAPPTALCPRL
jgi:hypothetical protein